MNNLISFSKVTFLAVLIFFSNISYSQSKVVWANKLLEYVDGFQYENNFAELVLGAPTIYPSIDMHEKHDPYAEGYILNFEKTNRKNEFKVGFPKAISANQIVIGGIFNIGTIDAIYIQPKDGKEKLVYKLDKPASKTKFKSFATFIPQNNVVAVRVVINHAKINEWNIIKGIGLYNNSKLYEIAPELIEDTTHKHKRELVGQNINSEDCFEFAPKIAPDGKTLYFVKECNNQPDQDIWYSELDSLGNWSDAKNIGVPLNNKGHNFVASISPDGNTLVIGNKYNEDGTDGGEGVSISTKNQEGKWTLPKSLDIPQYKNLNEHANFFMGEKGDVLVMAIQDSNSIGDLDLYVSLYDKSLKKWSTPKNLGTSVNTSFSEDYPYLAIDGKTLYFSSKGYTGYGGHDIYVTERLDNTWLNWSKPKNLGPFVNTKADDKGFVIASHGDEAYFNSASFDSDLHHMDIFKVDLPKMLHQEKRILISGIIFESNTKMHLRGNVNAKNESGDIVAYCSSNPKTGHYIVSIPFGKTYQLEAEVLEYSKMQKSVSLIDSTIGLEMAINFEFGKEEIENAVDKMAKNIFFEYRKANLTDNSFKALDLIADVLKNNIDARFEVIGHTDNVASQGFNQKLSEKRAKSVVDYLIQKGVNSNKIIYLGKGELQPIADNDTEEGRAKNRRVDLKFIE